MSESLEQVSLYSIYRTIGALLNDAALDHRVIDALCSSQRLLSRESHLWDYKRELGSSAHERSELIKDLVSFHNSYGGYILIGVSELDDGASCHVNGIAPSTIDEAQLRAQIRSYTGSPIEVAYAEIPVKAVVSTLIGLLFVPKRAVDAQPCVFQKNAAVAPNGKQAFKEGQLFLRSGDESRPMQGKDDLAFLLSARTMPQSILDDARTSSSLSWEPPLENNMPDKNVICPQFVGREEILNDLWGWLADPFSNVRVLAGEGGKGKTSIGYAFAIEFATRRPGNFSQVLWLTAKRRQFSGLTNKYIDMPESHFTDVDSMLRAIANRCGANEEELADTSTNGLKSICREYLSILPALVVIDDVDSVELNEQKRIMEVATQLAPSGSRFLLTTRVNLTYSNDICMTVPGLPRTEYKALVESLCKRLRLAPLSAGDTDRLLGATDGSPLLTESIIRLVKVGMLISTAIDQWRGHMGEDARNAALDKEIQQLSPEARRVLLCMTYLRECSLTELRQLTNYSQMKLTDAVTELQSLFLVNAPRVTSDEPRFAVPDLVRFLAEEKRSALALDHHKLMQDAATLRKGSSAKSTGYAKMVAAAMAQASAQLAQSDTTGAIRTLESALARNPKRPELQCFLARCYLKEPNPRTNEARDLFKKAYDGGNRRPEVFDGWFTAESSAGHWPGALHVASLVLEESPDDPEWRYRRAYAQSQIAIIRERGGDVAEAITVYESAAEDLRASIAGSRSVARQERINAAAALNDLLWARINSTSSHNDPAPFDLVFRAIKRGDFRRTMYDRLFAASEHYFTGVNALKGDFAGTPMAKGMLKQISDALAVRPLFSDDATFRQDSYVRLNKLQEAYNEKLEVRR